MNDPDIVVLTEMRALAARLTRSRDPLLAGAVAQLVGQIEGLLDLCSAAGDPDLDPITED